MSAPDSPKSPKIRRDGWTAERQLRFLDTLARTRSVTRAARAAGMSRESAYRLRRRKDGALFAAAWDRALEGPVLSVSKGHKLGSLSSRRRPSTARISRANPPKVTKWKKWKDPRFNAFEKLLRDFREMPV
jgi:molybdenum-dependent DNA-binding transcriptional regulator ModE